jgi:hypothetical protein
MSNYILYDLENNEFKNPYESDGPIVFGGPYGNPEKTLNMQIPDGIDYRKHNIVEVILEEGQTEDDIDFDHKIDYMSMTGPIVRYWKFEFNTDKSNTVDADDAVAAVIAAQQANLRKGKLFEELSGNVMAIVRAHVYNNGLTLEQKNTLMTTHSDVFQTLKDGLPLTAKTLIDAITPDGTLITQNMINEINMVYADFSAAYPDI